MEGAEENKVQEEEKVEEDEHDVDYTDPEQAAQSKIAGLANVAVKSGTEGEVCIYR